MVSMPNPDSFAPNLDWDRATLEANAWRGAALQIFGQMENDVCRTLLLLASLPGGEKLKLRHLVGQRVEDLARAIGGEGAFARKGARAAVSLEHFRRHDWLRAFLAHGVGEVALDRNGDWILVLKLPPSDLGPGRGGVALESRLCRKMLCDLKDDYRVLRSELQSLRDRLKAGTGAACTGAQRPMQS